MALSSHRASARAVQRAPRLQTLEIFTFTSVEEAWFWSLTALIDRVAGRGGGG